MYNWLLTIERIDRRQKGKKGTLIHVEISADDESDARRQGWHYCNERDKENPNYLHTLLEIRKVK